MNVRATAHTSGYHSLAMQKSYNEFRRARTRIIVMLTGAAAVFGGIGILAAGPTASTLKSYHFTSKHLAEPSTSTPNPPKVVPRPADGVLTLPPGFHAAIFADDI